MIQDIQIMARLLIKTLNNHTWFTIVAIQATQTVP